jgi:hypothetical protein
VNWTTVRGEVMKIIMATARRGVLLVCLGSSMAGGQPGGTVGPVGGGLMPYQQTIADAAKIDEPALRQVALRQAIEAGLLGKPYSVSSEVRLYLAKNSRWIDLRPFENIIRQYRGPTPASNYGDDWIGGIEWQYLSSADRARVCRVAIEQGQAVAPGGMIVNRYVAIQALGWYGLPELLPLARSYYSALDKISQQTLSLSRVAIEANLRSGCEDSEDCYDRAAERLAAMSNRGFRKRIERDPDFAAVLFGTGLNPGLLDRICEKNPFTGWINPGCGEVQRIYKRQAALDETIRAQQAAEGLTPTAPKAWWEWKGSWLDRLRGISYQYSKTRRPQ